MIMQNVNDSDDLQKVADFIRNLGASDEKEGALMSNILSRLAKKGIASAMALTMLASVTGCDVGLMSEPAGTDAGVETVTRVGVVLDEYGVVRTDENGVDVTEISEPKETKPYEILNLSDMKRNVFENIDVGEALSGKYMDIFNDHTYAYLYTRYNEDPRMEQYYKDAYGANAETVINAQQIAVLSMDNILKSSDKDFTWQVSMTGVPDTYFYFVINDDQNIFAITMQNTITGKEYIVEGVIGDQILYTEGFGFIKSEEGAELIRAYLSTNEFSNLSTRLFSYIPSLMNPYDIGSLDIHKVAETNIIYLSSYIGGDGSFSNWHQYVGQFIGFEIAGTVDNPQVKSVKYASSGFMVSHLGSDGNYEKINVPYGEILVNATNFGAQPLRQPILDELAKQDGAEISPDTEADTVVEPAIDETAESVEDGE